MIIFFSKDFNFFLDIQLKSKFINMLTCVDLTLHLHLSGWFKLIYFTFKGNKRHDDRDHLKNTKISNDCGKNIPLSQRSHHIGFYTQGALFVGLHVITSSVKCFNQFKAVLVWAIFKRKQKCVYIEASFTCPGNLDCMLFPSGERSHVMIGNHYSGTSKWDIEVTYTSFSGGRDFWARN